ncbi:MAG: HAD hydrolase family protein [Bacteroidetes bacterium]|nr:HAD hydrolase family protein [Bacteroidota bacterium]
MSNYKENLKNITTFIFDYDGVLTGEQLILTNDGEALRTANVKDGYAMQYAVKMGYRIAVISGGRAETIKKRFAAINVHDVFMGISNKVEVFTEYLKNNNLKTDEVLFMGDDIPDYHIMRMAGVATCPSDAAEEIKNVAAYISNIKGGEGCVRKIIEQVLKVQGKWFDCEKAFLW